MDKKREEHTMRVLQAKHGTFTPLFFFQSREECEGNAVCFIQDYPIYFQRNVSYQNR